MRLHSTALVDLPSVAKEIQDALDMRKTVPVNLIPPSVKAANIESKVSDLEKMMTEVLAIQKDYTEKRNFRPRWRNMRWRY